MKIFNLCIILLLFFENNVKSQIVINLDASTNGTTQKGCSFWFYDDGGSAGVYSSNQDRWITFQSNNGTNTQINLDFASFNIESGDTLYFYDGPTIASPLISKHNNDYNPLSIPNTVIQASFTNTSGDITVRFKTNGSGNYSGWNAAVYCRKVCQKINPEIDSLLFFPLPDQNDFIGACLGNSMTFAALNNNSILFPQNDIIYHQDVSTSLFIWDFSNGIKDTGIVVSHAFPSITGYPIRLNIVDINGCVSEFPFNSTVLISPPPIISFDSIICKGDISQVNVFSQPVNITSSSNLNASEIYDSLTFIPDGPSCPLQCYETPLTFTSFNSGDTISSETDLESICINMEHSFAGDLSFRIICPNGQSVVLDSYDNSGGSYLGVPVDDVGQGCTSVGNPVGVGWTYCWSEIYPQQGILNNLDAGTSPIPATDTINHQNYFTPENPFSSLIGCPLNGSWSIEICDNWAIDNGYVFWWTLSVQNHIHNVNWNYQIPLQNTSWIGYNISSNSDSSAIFIADSVGVFYFTCNSTDLNGCIETNVFQITVTDCNFINESQSVQEVLLFPNPATEKISIETPENNQEWIVVISTLTGQTIKQTSINKSTELNIEDLNSGIYMLKLIGKEVYNFKFIVK